MITATSQFFCGACNIGLLIEGVLLASRRVSFQDILLISIKLGLEILVH
jgi:hypothetical protein